MALVSLLDLGLSQISLLKGFGFGHANWYWTGIPLLLLYSYNKKPRHKALNVAVTGYYLISMVAYVLFAVGLILTLPAMISEGVIF